MAEYLFGKGALQAMGQYMNRGNDNERFIAHNNNPGGHWGIWDMFGGGNVRMADDKSDAMLGADMMNGNYKRSLHR